MGELPTGTVTFLFTDIEGSTRLWERHPDAMRRALARHDELLAAAIDQYGGFVFKTAGDAFHVAFATAPNAVAAALAAARAIQGESRDEVAPLRVRMALHTGVAETRDGEYFGPPLNRVARLLDAAHGGQILLSQTTAELVREALPEAATLRDLGTHRLKDLQQAGHLFQLIHPDLPHQFPPVRSLEEFAHNLPRQLTSFIGREQEIADVKRLLTTTPLLTLTGSGGCGKTRLAVQVAAELVGEFADGAWLVDLAPLSTPALVPETVAVALGVRELPGSPVIQALTAHLRAKTALLLLDNCEHLIDACADLAKTLLRSCPGLKILATSREALNIAGETPWRVPPLSLPDPRHLSRREADLPSALSQYEASRLFLERAQLLQPRFTLTQRNAAAVAQVCQRLDGIPLAIELAAARVIVLPVETINKRLDDRFRLLTVGSRTALPRQQTLRATIDWSYDLLSESERVLLRRLSVFAGGWTLEAAEEVCGDSVGSWQLAVGSPTDRSVPLPTANCQLPTDDILDLLMQLVSKSLVVYEEHAGQGRYRFLETLRQYGRERLLESGDGEAVQRRHRDYFLRLAEVAEPRLKESGQAEWLDRLELELDNLRAALDWCAGAPDGAEAQLRLAGALQRLWSLRGHSHEGRERLAAALSRAESAPRTAARAKALYVAAWMATDHGDFAVARILYEEALTIQRGLGDKHGIAVSLAGLGRIAYTQGDRLLARTLYEECLANRREAGDRRTVADCLHYVGLIAYEQGDVTAARALYEESLVIQRETDDKSAITELLNSLGNVAKDQGDYPRARSFLEEALRIARAAGLKWGVRFSLYNLGRVAAEQGDYAAAHELLEEVLRLAREENLSSALNAHILHSLGTMAYEQGDHGRTRSLEEEALGYYRELGYRWGIAASLDSLAMLAAAASDYPKACALHEESLAMAQQLGDAALTAQVLANRGSVARCLGDYPAARASYEESLAIRRRIENKRGVAVCLQGFAQLSLAQRQFERAVRLWEAAEALRQALDAPLSPRERGEYDQAAMAAREAMGEEALAAARAEGGAMSLEQAVACALEEDSNPLPATP